MHDILEIFTVVAASSVKLMASAIFSLGLGYGFWETFIYTSIGGCIGVFFFYRFSGWLMKRARLRRLHRAIAEKHGVVVRPAKRVFTKRNRWIIRVKQGSGLKGLAALTPVVLTIPIGSIIAARYFRHDRRTLPALMVAVVLQAMVLSAIFSVVFRSAADLAN